MRDTRPNNKRTLQSGQGLYGTRQTATRPRPGGQTRPAAPLPPRLPAGARTVPLPMFLGAGAAWGKPSSVPAVDPGHLAGALGRHRIRKGDRAHVDPRHAGVPCHHPPSPTPSAVGSGSRGQEWGRACGTGAPELGAAPREPPRVPACRANTVLLLVSSRVRPPPGRAAPARRPAAAAGHRAAPSRRPGQGQGGGTRVESWGGGQRGTSKLTN